MADAQEVLVRCDHWESERDLKIQEPHKEDAISFDMNRCLKEDKLPANLGQFNSHVLQYQMLVQTNLCLRECSYKELSGVVFLIHMEKHNRLMEGLRNVCFVNSIYEPIMF
jgi:hypothetical protein